MRSQRPDDHSKKYPVPTSSHCTKRTHGSHTRVHVEDLLNHTSSRCLHHALAVRRTSMPLEKGWFDREEVKKKNISCLFLMCFLYWSKDVGRGGLVHFAEIFYHYSPALPAFPNLKPCRPRGGQSVQGTWSAAVYVNIPSPGNANKIHLG